MEPVKINLPGKEDKPSLLKRVAFALNLATDVGKLTTMGMDRFGNKKEVK